MGSWRPIPASLPNRLSEQRRLLAKAWSPNTIHPDYSLTPEVPSRGQCGVSSAWLLHDLGWPRRILARYCHGNIVFSDGVAEEVTFHCWVEIGFAASKNRVVIDVTYDQFDQSDRLGGTPVLCDRHESLRSRKIEYQAQVRVRFRKLRKDPVWARFETLRSTTMELQGKNWASTVVKNAAKKPRAAIRRRWIAVASDRV